MLLLFFFFFFLSTVIIGIHAEPSATHQPTTRAKKERKKSSSHSIMPVCVATNDIASFDYLFMHIVSVWLFLLNKKYKKNFFLFPSAVKKLTKFFLFFPHNHMCYTFPGFVLVFFNFLCMENNF
jgi:hypothetical protein